MIVRAKLTQVANDVRDSYWALPGLIALVGLGAGLGMVYLDALVGDAWLGRYEWLYGSRPEGARSMLSTIAGSTITVAGVVFSITLAAVTYASGQFGPRLLGNFVRDRGNQATLGIFIGTYLYCLVVLRTIRSAAETSAETGGTVRDAFVPHAAMFGGLGLAILSTGVLIYFVHHVTSGIHIDNVIARVGRRLIDDVRERRDDAAPDPGPRSASSGQAETSIAANRTGYIVAIDLDELLTIACRHDLVVRPVARAGDFVSEGWPLLRVEGAPNEAAVDDCRDAVALGPQRTAQQDLRFGINELVEIASRTLSPGVNDPFTAIACIDWLGAALAELERSPPPTERMADDGGNVRVRLDPLRFDDFLAAAFGQLRSYVAPDPNARRRSLGTLDALARHALSAPHRAMIEVERAALAEMGADETA